MISIAHFKVENNLIDGFYPNSNGGLSAILEFDVSKLRIQIVEFQSAFLSVLFAKCSNLFRDGHNVPRTSRFSDEIFDNSLGCFKSGYGIYQARSIRF